MISASDFINTDRLRIDTVVCVPSRDIAEAQVKTFRIRGDDGALVYGLRTAAGAFIPDVPAQDVLPAKAARQ